MLKKIRSLFSGTSRSHKVLRTVITASLHRGVTIISSLISVPIVLNHLGTERYGVWMTAIALSIVFSLADGGITNGMISLVSNAGGSNNHRHMRRLIGSGLAVTIMTGMVFLAVALFTVYQIDWKWALNLPDKDIASEATTVIAVICISYVVALPAMIIRQTRLGLLHGSAIGLWDTFAALAAFIALLVSVILDKGLIVIAAAWAGAPVLVRYISAVQFFTGKGRDLLPTWHDIRIAEIRLLLSNGSNFMLLTLLQGLSIQIDQPLIAHFMGAEQVASFSVHQRLFLQIPILTMMVLAAQWPAYGDALGAGDYPWIKRQLLVTLGIATFVATLLCGLLAFFFTDILQLWVGDKVAAQPLLIKMLVLFGVVATLASCFFYFYFALGLYRRVLIAYTIMIVINVPLTIYLIPYLGSAGAIIATSVGYLLALIIPSFIALPKILRELPDLRDKRLAKLEMTVPA